MGNELRFESAYDGPEAFGSNSEADVHAGSAATDRTLRIWHRRNMAII